jgi:hypothetical protein
MISNSRLENESQTKPWSGKVVGNAAVSAI